MIREHDRDEARRPAGDRTALAISGFWVLVWLISSGPRYVISRIEEPEPLSWLQVLVLQAPSWLIWALFTPLILRLGRRVPLERRNWRRALLVHLPAGLGLGMVQATASVLVNRSLRPVMLESPFAAQWIIFVSAYAYTGLLFYGAVLGVGYAVEYYRRYRDREVRASQLEARLARAQLQALRMEVNPHFLFNALHAVATLVRKRENDDAVRMIAGLGELLRHALEDADDQEIRLEEELRFLERYLEIERVRFQDRLQVTVDVAPELLDLRVPSLVLQPLVENAIRHGIAKRAAAGRIHIRARRLDGRLELEVEDDGPGLAPGWTAGVGIGNTRARLETLYGAGGRVRLEGGDESGAVATVVVPLRQGPVVAEGA